MGRTFYLSFLIIVPIIIKYSGTFFEKLTYFVFNGLIIYSLAISTNIAGEKLSASKPNALEEAPVRISNVYPINFPEPSSPNASYNEKESQNTSDTITYKRNFFSSWF